MSSETPAKLSKQSEATFFSTHTDEHSIPYKCFKNLIEACDFLEKNNIPISVARVGEITKKYARTNGSLKAQSIRNSKAYHDYDNARRAEQGSVTSSSGAVKCVRTGDANVDSYIQLLESRNSHLESQLKNLKMAISRGGDYDLAQAIERGILAITDTPRASSHALVVDAIETLLKPNNLTRVGLELTRTGQIIAPEMMSAMLLSKAQVQALRSFVLEVTNITPPKK